MKKKILALLICALLLTSMALPALAAASPPEGLPFAGEDLSGQVVILHTNDSHGHADDNMGYAAVAALKKEYENAGAEVLMLDAGDTFHGMPFATLNEGADVPPVLNQIGYDAMTTGNHDFNYGLERLKELEAMLDFPVVAANVLDKESGEALFEPNIIIEKGGFTFGVFGLTTPDTAFEASPDKVADIEFADPSETAREQVALLQEAGVDTIIALTHLGVNHESAYTSDQLAADVEGIDLIIDGHSHTEMAGGVPLDTSIELVDHGDTVIASTGAFIQNIGVIKMEDGAFDAQLVNGDTFTETDGEVEAIVSEIKAQQDEILSQVITSTPVDLNGEREDVRTKETNLGDVIADAFIATTGADAAFMNGGSIRASIPQGDITKEDLITVFPFGNYLTLQEITGATLLEALEHGVSGYPEQFAAFLHPGGMTFSFDASQPAGSRVSDLQIGGEAVDPEKIYKVAYDDFLAAGGDDFTMLLGQNTLGYYGAVEDSVAEYLKSEPEISAEPAGRITMLNDAQATAEAATDESQASSVAASAVSSSVAADESEVPPVVVADSSSMADASSASVSAVESASVTAASSSAVAEEPADVLVPSSSVSSEVQAEEEEDVLIGGEEETADDGAEQEAIAEEPAQTEEQEGAIVFDTYTVEEGDTLWDIAEEQLGNGELWSSIYQLNAYSGQNVYGIQNPNLIYPGQVFLLPQAA